MCWPFHLAPWPLHLTSWPFHLASWPFHLGVLTFAACTYGGQCTYPLVQILDLQTWWLPPAAPVASGTFPFSHWCKDSTCTRGGCHRLQLALAVLSIYIGSWPNRFSITQSVVRLRNTERMSTLPHARFASIIARCVWPTCGGSMAESTPTKLQVPLDSQSIVLPVSEIIWCTSKRRTCGDGVRVFHQQGEERIHVSHLSPDGKLLEYPFEDAKTLYEAFLRGMRVSSRLL